MDFIEDPQALLAAINNPGVVAGYKSDDNVEEILHAAAEKEGPQDFDEMKSLQLVRLDRTSLSK